MPQTLSIDFFVPVIDNYGDTGFAYSLAVSLLSSNARLHIRLVTSDVALVGRLAGGSLPHGLSVVSMGDFFGGDFSVSPTVATFFGYRFPSGYRLGRGICRELRFDYLQFDAGYRRHGGVRSIHATTFAEESCEVTHFVPSWVRGGGGVVLAPKSDDSRLEAVRRLPLSPDIITELETHADLPWLSVFCYPDTVSSVRAALSLVSEPHLLLWHTPCTGPVDAHCHVNIPFLPLREYARLIGVTDANVVRGENSLVMSVSLGRPTLWDPYRESNSAHVEKVSDYLHNLSDRTERTNKFAEYSHWQESFAGEDRVGRIAAVRGFVSHAPSYTPLFEDMARDVRESADIVPRVLAWLGSPTK